MRRTGPDGDAPLDPLLSPAEREEQRCLAYLLAEVDRLRDRGLIPEESHATIVAEARARRGAIETEGRYKAEISAARRLVVSDPGAAAGWAGRARLTDPGRQEAWALELDLRRRLLDDEQALTLCAEAAERFPDFPVRPDDLRREIEGRAARGDEVARARAALQRGEDAEVISVCTAILDGQPDHYDATVLLAFASQRLGRLDEALRLYQRLLNLEPENPAWREWVRNVAGRLAARPGVPTLDPVAPTRAGTAPAAKAPAPTPAPAPRISWSVVTAEVLQDHWQKLILCLAVLLIVVSSNVGAYNLLGPKLWSPVGKCVLALVYTAMFAGLGVGLVRWGAERAGRIMLLTTLIVAPANFMLVGQMKLLTEPDASRLAVLGLDAAALFVLIRVVVSSLRVARGAGFLATALFTVSAFNAAAAPGEHWNWAGQFAVFLAPVFLFLAATVWLTTRFSSAPFEGRRETTYCALGLLAFATITGLIRTGVFALDLVPTLYAVPVMVLAVACVAAASGLSRFDPDERHQAWLRFAGLVLSGLSIALALARPPAVLPLYSGNTLAAALFGLGLYAALLRKERQPAYLYFGFGALVVAYFGVFYFAKDLMHAVEEAARRRMGYEKKLPEAFRAINGLVFSPLLAGLSIRFRRSWGDARLARHCHYLGVPLSVAACVLSGFEPKAGLICLPGYAVLYAVAVRVFAAPRVIYLATAALAGAAYFGSTLAPGGTTPAGQAFGGSVLGLAYWLLGLILTRRGVGRSYRAPLDHSALGMAALAVFGATLSVSPPDAFPLAAASAFVVVALIAVLVNLDEPNLALGYLAVASGNAGFALLVLHTRGRWPGGLTLAHAALASATPGLVGAWLGRRLDRLKDGSASPERLAVYPMPLFHAAFAQVGLALLLCGLYVGQVGARLVPADFATLALALGLAGAALTLLTRPYPFVALAHVSIGCGLGVWLCLFQVAMGGAFARFASYGAAATGYALLLLGLEEAARVLANRKKTIDPDFGTARAPGLGLFAAALPGFEVGLVTAAVVVAAAGGANGPAVVVTLGAGAAALLWSTRLRKVARLVDLSLALATSSALCFTAWRVGWSSFGSGLAWLALTTAAVSLAFWIAARLAAGRDALALHVGPLLRASAALTWPVFVLAVIGPIDTQRSFPVGVAALGLNAVVLVLLALVRRQPGLTYRAVVSGVIAVYVVLFSVGKGDPEMAYVLGLAAVLQALALSGLGFACRARATVENARERLFAAPLFVSSLALTVLAIGPAYHSPWTMALVALSFLVMVKGVPSRHWLYPTIGSLACVVYFAVLSHGPHDRLVPAAMAFAYVLWLAALLVRRAEPTLVHWLQLADRGHDQPVFHSAGLAGLAALGLRLDETLGGTLPPSASAGLAVSLAVFCLLMVKAYPHPGWVHAALVLASSAVGLAAYPRIEGGGWWLSLGMAVAILWHLVGRACRRHESPVLDWLGVPERGCSAAVDLWSKAIFTVTTATTAVLVCATVVGALTGEPGPIAPTRGWEWSGLLLSLALGVLYVVISWRESDPAGVVMAAEAFAVLAVWWLAAPASPLVARLALVPTVYLPLATAAVAAGTVGAGLRLANRPGWRGAFWRPEPVADPRARLDAFAMQAGLGLAVLAVLMTRAEVGPATVGTLLLATSATGAAAVARRWVAGGYVAALAWSAAAVFAGLESVRRAGVVGQSDQFVYVAVGALASLAALWAAAGLLRRLGPDPGEPDARPTLVPAGSVALAMEQAAFAAAIFAATATALSTQTAAPPGRAAALTAVAVLFGLCLFGIGLIVRWALDWLVYASQSALLAGYLYYRWAFPLPAQTDALVLTLFGYLDLGLAEGMYRVGLARFARPTRLFSLALPVLPLALTVGEGGLGGMRLFVLFSAATFYGVAGLSMRWKSLGYAAAVLYNGFLWLLWARFGWTVADHSQFYLIPVGLSAILFAEVNREPLGRQPVNTIRGLGLSVIYLSLAAPIWRTADFGPWLTLLLVSLVGIFVGIGLRIQVFLWLGLVSFVLDVVYQLGRMGLEHTVAKWAIMLALGLLLILFVALNEKKRIVVTMRDYFEDVRQWE